MDKSLQLGIPTKKIVSQRWDMLSVRVLVNILFKSGKTKKNIKIIILIQIRLICATWWSIFIWNNARRVCSLSEIVIKLR